MKRNPSKNNEIMSSLFDVIIVGGGITGAGILMEAGKNGLNTILIEKGDFASGTSSKSAKLAHGGLRYLKYGHFRLVKEALNERDYLLKTYPHLVKPLSFIYPIYNTKLKIQVFLAMLLYLLLNLFSSLSGFKYYNRKKTLKKYPNLNTVNLKGSYMYYDAVTSDARLCNEIIHKSKDQYSTIALNYFELISYEQKKDCIQLKCIDRIENKEVILSSKYVVNASGPWMDEISKDIFSSNEKITAPSKGSHIILSKKRFPIESSLLFSTMADDNRWLYTVPWEHNTVIIGATDTDYNNAIDEVKVDISDDTYILNAINHIVPDLNISKDDIICSFVGIRPLLKDKSVSSKDRSREYKVWWLNENILNVYGGKLTSFHSMARKSIILLNEKLGANEITKKIISKNKINPNIYDFPKEFISNIKERYNDESDRVFTICKEDRKGLNKLHNDFEIYIAEIIYFIRHQSCYCIDDVLGRRLSLSYVLPKFTEKEKIVDKTAEIFKKELEWNDEKHLQEKAVYLKLLKEKNLYL